jgi:hypothetical protein
MAPLTRAYKQFGNSVAVPVFSAVARFMMALIHIDIGQDQIHAKRVKTIRWCSSGLLAP